MKKYSFNPDLNCPYEIGQEFVAEDGTKLMVSENDTGYCDDCWFVDKDYKCPLCTEPSKAIVPYWSVIFKSIKEN